MSTVMHLLLLNRYDEIVLRIIVKFDPNKQHWAQLSSKHATESPVASLTAYVDALVLTPRNYTIEKITTKVLYIITYCIIQTTWRPTYIAS